MRLSSYSGHVASSLVKTATPATRGGPAATKKNTTPVPTLEQLAQENGTLCTVQAQQPDSMLLVDDSQQCQPGLDCSRRDIGRLPSTPVAMAVSPASSLLASDSNQPTPPVHQNFKRVVRSATPRTHPRLITLLPQRTQTPTQTGTSALPALPLTLSGHTVGDWSPADYFAPVNQSRI